ncbi:MAG: hypothetical protein Q4G07_05630 [Oscillospiraceae bacterium]|nr:hypothetical protein [Oscillospiraceae bacterium]
MKKMDPYLKSKLFIILKLLLFAVFTALVIIGHGVEGFAGIGLMLAGLVCLLGLLYVYNRSYVDRPQKNAKK